MLFKKILTYLLKKLLFPLLNVIFQRVVMEFSHWIIARIREFFRERRKREEEAASSEKEREDISKKHDRIDADLASLEKEIPAKIQEIIQTTFKEADKQANLLLRESAKTPALKNVEEQLQHTKSDT